MIHLRENGYILMDEENHITLTPQGEEIARRMYSSHRALTEFLAAQDQESRLIFLRRYWFAESIEEIALRYGITQSKVKTRLHRTRCKLREYLQKEGIAL